MAEPTAAITRVRSAQRLEVDQKELRITASKSVRLRTLVAAWCLPGGSNLRPPVYKTVLQW